MNGEVAESMKGPRESPIFFSWASHIVPRLNSRSCVCTKSLSLTES